MAQDAAAADGPDAVVTEETAADAAAADALLGDDDLDELVAPVALYPDSLLTQVLVAATYPIDIVKADRFITTKADLSDKDRAAAAEQEDWDPSVQVLAGGFPTVVQHMATEIDWTEELGDALLVQSDDVLDAVQRQRARAVAVGNLTTNEAQVVDEQGDNISIEPAEPDVVYVPQYDASTAYTTPYTAPPVVATAATGYSTSNLLTTGAIAFGSALLINEIFDDDDDWDNYWRPGPSHIDWDNGDFHPRPNVDINGDVNINRNRNNVIANRDRTDIDRNRIGGNAADRGDAWRPSNKSRDDARARVSERKAKGGGASAGAAKDKLAARGGGKGASRDDISAKLKEHKAPPAVKAKGSAFSPQHIDAKKTRSAIDRGSLSKQKGGATKALTHHPKAVSRSTKARPPVKKAAPKSSAFKQHSGGSHKASAAHSRGSRSAGGHRRH